MLEIICGELRRSERELRRYLRPLSGLALFGFLPPVPRTREIDCLLIRPHGIWTIEVKHSVLGGSLQPNANLPWRVDGRVQDQLGNPTAQARRQAQIVGPLLRQLDSSVIVHPVVLVTGDVRIDEPLPAHLPVVVATVSSLVQVLEDPGRQRREPLSAPLMSSIFSLLGLDQALPSRRDLVGEGFAASCWSEPRANEPPTGSTSTLWHDPRIDDLPDWWPTSAVTASALLLRVWDHLDEVAGIDGYSFSPREWAREFVTEDARVSVQVANLMEILHDDDEAMRMSPDWADTHADAIVVAAQRACRRLGVSQRA